MVVGGTMKDNQIAYIFKGIKMPRRFMNIQKKGKSIPIAYYEQLTWDDIKECQDDACFSRSLGEWVCDIKWFDGQPYLYHELHPELTELVDKNKTVEKIAFYFGLDKDEILKVLKD